MKPVNICCLEIASEMVYHSRSFKSSQKLNIAMSLTTWRDRGNNCQKRSLTKVSANGVLALKTQYSVMAVTLNNEHVCYLKKSIKDARDLNLSRTTWSYSRIAFSFVKLIMARYYANSPDGATV